MKLFNGMLLSFAVLASASVFANNALPVLTDAKVAIDNPPELAAVQTGAYLTFTYTSCAERSFSVKKTTRSSVEGPLSVVTVKLESDLDCMGPVSSRQYSLQISSDILTDGKFVLANPSVLPLVRE